MARNSIIIFTDGSSIPEQGVIVAALIVNTTSNKTRFTGTTESVSNFEAELMGIQLATDLIQEETTMNKFKTKRKKIAEKLATLAKGIAALIHQLRAGDVPLNDHLTRIKSISNYKCPECSRRETINHFLLYCHAYRKARNKFRKTIIKNKMKTNFYKSELILDSPDAFLALGQYIMDTNRFPHIRNYLKHQS
ncbi:hypothetical protein O181_032796 [Austropuccinia psidii MF-1]|uniref:RNase H type-1 domain-containing protein n=1 Tax=Austropuccinia psidii MF-1 TaxID=1389203 RepID=A0A9Q3CXH4_9BASI|nr:hypothetical protein [Austropuccinia psidii MF-1]